MDENSAMHIKNKIAETENTIRSAVEKHGEHARLINGGTAYPLAVAYTLAGQKILSIKDLHKCVHIQKELAEAGGDASFAAGLVTLLAEEVHNACAEPGGQACFIPDAQVRRWGGGLAFGDTPALAIMTGAASDAREAVNTVNDYRRRGIRMLVDGSLAHQCDVQTESGRVTVMDGENAFIEAISAVVRFALIFGGVCPGDRKALSRYVKTNMPVFINAFGPREGDLRRLEGAAALGIPVLCDRQTESAHLIGASNHREMIEKSLRLRGIPLEEAHKPSIPVPYSASYEEEPSGGQAGAQLDVAFTLVLTRKTENVKDHAVTLVGPDLSKEASALPLGILIEIYGRRMKSAYESVIEKNVPRWLSCAEGISCAIEEGKARILISGQAFDKGIRAAHLGEIIYTEIKSAYPALAEKCAVTLITDAKTVRTLKQEAADPKYEMRGMQKPAEDAYTCTLCAKIAPDCGCAVTQDKPGACGRMTLGDAILLSENARSGAIKQDRAGEGVYSIRAGQTGFGGFTCVSAILPKAKGVIVLDDDYTGNTPLGLRYCEIAAMTDGAFPTPGYMGHARDFITSPKYLAAEGGPVRIVWMPKALKEALRSGLNETARALYGIQNFSDMVCDETVTTESEALIGFLVEKKHPVIDMAELI